MCEAWQRVAELEAAVRRSTGAWEGARGEARDVEKRGVGINAEGGKRESDDET